MTKWQLIDDIQRLNRSATREFLEQFQEKVAETIEAQKSLTKNVPDEGLASSAVEEQLRAENKRLKEELQKAKS